MAKVEKDVSRQVYLVNRMQQEKPAKSRQESGAWTPSEGKSATYSEDLYGDDCGKAPPIHRKISPPGITSPHSEMKKNPKEKEKKKKETGKSSQDGSGTQNQIFRRYQRKFSGTPQVLRASRQKLMLWKGCKRQKEKEMPSKLCKPFTGRSCHLQKKGNQPRSPSR